jgi:hypothetical protein
MNLSDPRLQKAHWVCKCLLCVISGHADKSAPCPLHPQKRTLGGVSNALYDLVVPDSVITGSRGHRVNCTTLHGGTIHFQIRSAANYFTTSTWHGASSTSRSVVLPMSRL